jgi:sugar lactone lactonase YvrE
MKSKVEADGGKASGPFPLLASYGFLLKSFLFIGALCAAGATYAASYYFTTLAGESSVGQVDGTGQSARFFGPAGIALDREGNAYVADTSNHAIRRVTAGGVVTTVAGKAGERGAVDGKGSAARFNAPQGLALDQAGNLYVGDVGNNLIRKVTPDGVVMTLAGKAGEAGTTDGEGSVARFRWPVALAVDVTGMIFVADGGVSTIRRITPAGVVTTWAGKAGESDTVDGDRTVARFREPRGIAFDPAGNLFVTDHSEPLIRKISPAGVVSTVAGSRRLPKSSVYEQVDGAGGAARFAFPEGIAIDAAGFIYITDWQTVRKISPAGEVTTLAGRPRETGDEDGPGAQARFGMPIGMGVDVAGNLYVADAGNNTIRRISNAGNVSTLAGLSAFAAAGEQDGTGHAARFFEPAGVAVGPGNTIYVSDSGNHTVRKISAGGEVTTLAGVAGHPGAVDGTGTAARLNAPTDLVVDAAGNVFVADLYNRVIRKIRPDGSVSVFSGQLGQAGSVDGPATSATFLTIEGMTRDVAGNLYVVDFNRVRRISVTGEVTTLASFSSSAAPHTRLQGIAIDAAGKIYVSDTTYGDVYTVEGPAFIPYVDLDNYPISLAVDASGRLFCVPNPNGSRSLLVVNPDKTIERLTIGTEAGHRDGVGMDARFAGMRDIAFDAGGNLYLAESGPATHVIRKGVLAGAPTIMTQPLSLTVSAGSKVQFSVTAAAIPAPTYQWYFNTTAIGGATGSAYEIPAAQAGAAGDYTVMVTNELGSVTSTKAALTVNSAPVPPSGGGQPSSGGGGGGGAPSFWFIGALAALSGVRGWHLRRGPAGGGQVL